jgi:hypothetical protein
LNFFHGSVVGLPGFWNQQPLETQSTHPSPSTPMAAPPTSEGEPTAMVCFVHWPESVPGLCHQSCSDGMLAQHV